jgi:hypothetical protein
MSPTAAPKTSSTAPPALPQRHPEADDRSYRGEERLLVPERDERQKVRGARRHGGLDHRPAVDPEPLDASRKTAPKPEK